MFLRINISVVLYVYEGNLTVKNVGMNPSKPLLDVKCKACGEKLCMGARKDCNTGIVFKYKCLGCDKKYLSKGTYDRHTQGKDELDGCVLYAVKFASYCVFIENGEFANFKPLEDWPLPIFTKAEKRTNAKAMKKLIWDKSSIPLKTRKKLLP